MTEDGRTDSPDPEGAIEGVRSEEIPNTHTQTLGGRKTIDQKET